MDNETWYILGFLLVFILTLVFICILESRRVSRYQRLIVVGIGQLVLSGLWLHRLVTRTDPVPFAAAVLATLPGLGGVLLLVVGHRPKLEDSIVEYMACALAGGAALAYVFASNQSLGAQWGTALVATLVGYGMQRAAGRPFSHGRGD
jgi:hypothetical protein